MPVFETSTAMPYIYGALVLALAVLFDVIFRGPSNLHRPGARIKTHRSRFPGLGAVALFEQRNSFLRNQVFGQPESWDAQPPPPEGRASRLNARSHVLTVTANPQDRKVFFNDRSLDFESGYSVLFAGIPSVPDWLKFGKKKAEIEEAESEDKSDMGSFNYNLKSALNPDRIERSLPTLFKYILEAVEQLPPQGRIECHETVYSLVFRLSLVGVGLTEQHRDLESLAKVEKPFWSFADNAGYLQTLFPLLFTPSTVRKWKGTIDMATNITQLVEQRKKTGERFDDYPQALIDRGVPTKQIIDFVMGSLFAAIINTTGITSYAMLFSFADESYQQRLRDELDGVLRAEAEARGDDYDALSVADKLTRVPLSAWEDSSRWPFFDAVERETLRKLMISVLFRKKVSSRRGGSSSNTSTTTLSGEPVADSEFAAFWLSSVHCNSTIYTDPAAFDPDRWLRGEGKGEGDFLGWGAGLHPCLGMRFAKLEIRVTIAAFLLAFPTMATVDEKGAKYDRNNVPNPSIDSEHARRPTKPAFIAYSDNVVRAEAVRVET